VFWTNSSVKCWLFTLFSPFSMLHITLSHRFSGIEMIWCFGEMPPCLLLLCMLLLSLPKSGNLLNLIALLKGSPCWEKYLCQLAPVSVFASHLLRGK
jgi:hypothetical protein